MPLARVTVLRMAFNKTMADQDFLRDAERSHLDVNPVPGERVESLVRQMVGTPPAIVEQANRWMSPPK